MNLVCCPRGRFEPESRLQLRVKSNKIQEIHLARKKNSYRKLAWSHIGPIFFTFHTHMGPHKCWLGSNALINIVCKTAWPHSKSKLQAFYLKTTSNFLTRFFQASTKDFLGKLLVFKHKIQLL